MSAVAAPPCPAPPEPTYLLRGQTTLESVIVDERGHLFFTNETSLLRLDRRDTEPKRLTDVQDPGGLAFDTDGKLLLGYGNTSANGSHGDIDGPSGLVKVDPDSGETMPYATGLSMANGLVRGPDGSFYASNDFGSNIDRIRDGETERGWAKVESGNGLVIDSSGRYLYAAQTFRPAAIARVDLTDPSQVTTYMLADEPDYPAGLDGLAIDAADSIYAAANGAGEIWKIARTKDGGAARPCVLLDDLPPFPDGPSAVAVGVGDGPFGAGNLYVVTFDGNVIELPRAAALPPPEGAAKLRLEARPRVAREEERTRFTFIATLVRADQTTRMGGVSVHFAGKKRRTGRRGRAAIVATPRRAGRLRARARHSRFGKATATIRVLPRPDAERSRR